MAIASPRRARAGLGDALAAVLLLAERLVFVARGGLEMGRLRGRECRLAVLGREGRVHLVGLVEAGGHVGEGLRLDRRVLLAGGQRERRHAQHHCRDRSGAKASSREWRVGHRASFNW